MKIIVVDEKDNVIGSKERDDRNEKDIVRVSGIFVFNSKKETLIAQRALDKVFNPGKWGPAAAGTLEEGETYLSNIVKETEEEIGVKINEKDLTLGPYEFVDSSHRYFRQMYYTKLDLPIFKFKVQKEEVNGLRWIGTEELREWLATSPNDFTESSPKLMKELIDFLNDKDQ